MRRLRHQVVSLVLSGLLIGVAVASDAVPVGKSLPHTGRIEALVFSPDGRMLVVGSSDAKCCLWDTATGDLIECLDVHDDQLSLAFSHHGRLLATGGRQRTTQLWDVATGEELRRRDDLPGWVCAIAFSPDDQLLAMSTFGNPEKDLVDSWTAANGEVVRQLKRNDPKVVQHLCFSSSGHYLLCSHYMPNRDQGTLRLWEVWTGELVKEDTTGQIAPQIGFASDGDVLAWYCDSRGVCRLTLWDGEELSQMTGHRGEIQHVAVSPGSRYLVTSGSDRTVRLWDVFTGEEVRRLQDSSRKNCGPVAITEHAHLVAWASDNEARLLPTGLYDQLEAAYDIRGSSPHQDLDRLLPDEADRLWANLSDAEPSRAYSAIRRFARAPKQSVPYLRSRLQPVPTISRERLVHLIAELDNESFEVRQKATRELEQLDWGAELALQKALLAHPSAESRRRIEQLLERLREPVPVRETLRQLRALEVLEIIGTPEARNLLVAVANGAEGAMLTREAKASLERRRKRAGGSP